MPVVDQSITHDGSEICIFRPKFSRIAYATYADNLYDMIASTTWIKTTSTTGKEYIKSQKFGLLHQLVIGFFYGKSVLNECKGMNSEFVIDHLDNDGYDCRLENMAIIPRLENSAKGLIYDVERKNSIKKYAVNITKDFSTQEFQITITFNNPSYIMINGIKSPLSKLCLIYGEEYKTAFLEAQSILNDLNKNNMLDSAKLRCKHIYYENSEVISATPEEAESGIITRNGQDYIVQGSKHIFAIKSNHRQELHGIE